jgi:hypothetical protein
MESIENSSYYIIDNDKAYFYNYHGDFLTSVTEFSDTAYLNRLLDPITYKLLQVSKIVFVPDETQTTVNYYDKNGHIIESSPYSGQLSKKGLLIEIETNEKYLGKFKNSRIDFDYIRKNNIEIDLSQMEKNFITNSSYYVLPKKSSDQFVKFYDRSGSLIHQILAKPDDYKFSSCHTYEHMLDPNTRGKIRVNSIYFSHHVKLGDAIYFVDKNDNIVLYKKYDSHNFTKNGVIQYFKHHDYKGLTNAMIDFEHIRINDISVCYKNSWCQLI